MLEEHGSPGAYAATRYGKVGMCGYICWMSGMMGGLMCGGFWAPFILKREYWFTFVCVGLALFGLTLSLIAKKRGPVDEQIGGA